MPNNNITSSSPKVDYEHPDYEKLAPTWSQIKDCLTGERAVKGRREKYLPKPNAYDLSEANKARYTAYLLRAVFYNNTYATLTGLVGQVFAKASHIEIDSLLDPVVSDTDGSGLSIDQAAKSVLSDVLSTGRAGVFVDYPMVDAAATRKDQNDGSIRPNIITYPAESIINWRTKRVGAENKLSLVVIVELANVADDGFAVETVARYRALHLTDGVYHVEVYERSIKESGGTGSGDFTLTEEFTPVDASGRPLTEIPFTFVGAENNDPTPDLPPMADLTVVNLAHYRNSADYEEALYMVGQPTPFFSGLTEAWVAEVMKGQIYLGSRAAVMLPEGGGAGLLQAEPNSMPKEGMDAKERQMVALGAKLVEQKTVQRTATEAGIDVSVQTSILASSSNNTSEAFQTALEWCALFMGSNSQPEYVLNTDFDIVKMDSTNQTALLALWQNDVLTWDEARDNLRRGGMLLTDNEEARTVVESEALNDMAEPTLDSKTEED